MDERDRGGEAWKKERVSQVARNESRSNSATENSVLEAPLLRLASLPIAEGLHVPRKRLPRTEREREEAKEEGSVTRFAWSDSSKTNHHALCCAVACWKPRWIFADVRPFDVTDKSGVVINGANANFTAVPWNWNGCRSPKSGRSVYDWREARRRFGSGNREPFERDSLVMDDFLESRPQWLLYPFTFLHLRNPKLSSQPNLLRDEFFENLRERERFISEFIIRGKNRWMRKSVTLRLLHRDWT